MDFDIGGEFRDLYLLSGFLRMVNVFIIFFAFIRWIPFDGEITYPYTSKNLVSNGQ